MRDRCRGVLRHEKKSHGDNPVTTAINVKPYAASRTSRNPNCHQPRQPARIGLLRVDETRRQKIESDIRKQGQNRDQR